MRICLYSVSDHLCSRPCLPFGVLEERRLSSLRNPERKKESLCALLALRELVGESSPAILRSSDGKPYFSDPSSPAFSLCHTKDWAVAVLGDSQSGSVGVDLERVRPYPQAADIAHRFFNEKENAALVESDESELVFFRLWTKKEAIAKMNGVGLLAKEQTAPAFSASFLLIHGEESFILTVCAEHPVEALSFQSPSEKFEQFHIEEMR